MRPARRRGTAPRRRRPTWGSAPGPPARRRGRRRRPSARRGRTRPWTRRRRRPLLLRLVLRSVTAARCGIGEESRRCLLLVVVEEVSQQELYDSFNTNVFGIFNTIKAFLPGMREQSIGENGKRGTVVTFGSIGSWRGGATYSVYSMVKTCVSSLAESLREEVEPFNIVATVVEPGYFRTGFLNAGSKVVSKNRMAVYDDESTPTGKTRRMLDATDNNQPGDVKKGSKVIVEILTGTGVGKGRSVPVRIMLGSDADAFIRKKCEETLGLLDEWKEVVLSTDLEK